VGTGELPLHERRIDMPKRAVVGEEGPEWWWKKYPRIETEEELNPDLLVPKYEWPPELGCRVKGCNKNHHSRGLCQAHTAMRTNHPIARKAKRIIARQQAPKRDLEFTPLAPVYGTQRKALDPSDRRYDVPRIGHRYYEEWEDAVMAWEDDKGERWEKLTEIQEDFCQHYIIERLSATEAARRAGVGKAEGSTDQVIARRAQFWLNIHPVVRNRLYELREELRAKHRVTLEDHLVELSRLREQAISVNQMSAAITAEKARGAAAGLYVQRTEVTVAKVDSMSKDDVLKRLEEMKAEHDAHIIDITPDRSTLIDDSDPLDGGTEGSKDQEPRVMDVQTEGGT